MGTSEFVKIERIQPTIFFKNSPRGLEQVVELTIHNPREEANAGIVIKFLNQRTQRMIFGLKSGKGTYRIEMPALDEGIKVTFEISLEGKFQDQHQFTWPATKRWEIYLVQSTHHHLNYSNLPEENLRAYHKYFNQLSEFCETTASYPFEARFRYTIETVWPLIHFIRYSPRPEVDKLMNFIRKGRIEVAALFDNLVTQIASGEELIRLLYPVFRLKRIFRIPIRSAILNRVSGFSWGLATILADAGIQYFTPQLPVYSKSETQLWDEKTILPHGAPDAFHWETPNGQKLLFWYGDECIHDLDLNDPAAVEKYLLHLEQQDYAYPIVRRVISGASRDNAPPTRDFCEAVQEWSKQWAFPKLVLSTNAQFFDRLTKDLPNELPTFRGELPGSEYPVTITSSAQPVATARQTQNQLICAEKLATLCGQLTDFPYPFHEFRSAYEMLLLFDDHSWGQFHPFGAAHTAVLTEKNLQANRAAAYAHDILMHSLNKIADQIQLPDDQYHLIVFNTLSFARTDTVSADFMVIPPSNLPLLPQEKEHKLFPRPLGFTTVSGREMIQIPLELVDGFELIDVQKGQNVPYQIDEINDPGDATADAASRYALGQENQLYLKRMLFIAKEVPAFGYKAYQLRPVEKVEVIPKRAEVSVKTLENRFYRIIVATNTGGIFSIYDKELQQDFVDGFSHFRINQIFVHSTERNKIYKLENVNIRREQRGSITTSLIITGSTVGCPQCIQEITLYNDLKRIDFTNRILKDATPLQEVYFAFPFQLKAPRLHFEGPLTILEPIKDQFPGSPTRAHAVQRWVALSDDNLTVAWASLDAPVIRLGGLWTESVPSTFQLLSPKKQSTPAAPLKTLPNAHLYSLVTSGNYRQGFSNSQVCDLLFRYAITSFPQTENDVRPRNFGLSRAEPLLPVFIKGPQDGQLSDNSDFMQLTPENITLMTFKKSEVGDHLIVRLWETGGKDTTVQLTLKFAEIQSASRLNLVEEELTPLEITTPHSLSVPMKAREVATVQVVLKK